jgi:hypothetical protein
MSCSGEGNSRSCLRRGVGGTGGGTCLVLLGSRVLTASRSGSPGGTVAPQVLQVRPPRFTPSHTGQRHTALMVCLDQRPSAAASRRGDLLGQVRKPPGVVTLCAGPSREVPSVPAVLRAPRLMVGPP